MASINDLPDEILQLIMAEMRGVDAWRCRGVCRRWCDVVDALPDRLWRHICLRDHGDRSSDFARSGLTWKELYRSITLWQHVKKAKITVDALPSNKLVDFQLLDNEILAAIEVDYTITQSYDMPGNTVVYYNLDTLQEIKRVTYDLVFTNYQENETFITFSDCYNNFYITLKANGKRHNVGQLDKELLGYRVLSREVFFLNNNCFICVAKIVEENGEKTIKVEEKGHPPEAALTFSYASKEQSSDDLYILGEFGRIYHFNGKDFNYKDILYDVGGTSAVEIMLAYGFDWTQHKVFRWFLKYASFSRRLEPVFNLNCTTAGHCNDAVIFGTNEKLKIYVEDDENPFFYTGRPARIIDLKKIICDKFYDGVYSFFEVNILKVSVVERKSGHRIIISVLEDSTGTKSRVYVLDLVHEVGSHEELKAKMTPLKPILKLKRRKLSNKSLKKHKYNTRSSRKNYLIRFK